MDQITFTQKSYLKPLIFIIIYGIIIVSITFYLVGKYATPEFMKLYSENQMIRVIIMAIVSAPIYFLFKLGKTKIYISFYHDKIRINHNKILDIPIYKIDYIKVNDPMNNTIKLYSKDELLYSFNGYHKNQSTLDLLERKITEKGNFEKIEYTKKVKGYKFQARRYNKI